MVHISEIPKIHLIGHIGIDTSWWSSLGSVAVIIAALIAGWYSLQIYNKNKADQKLQTYLQLMSKSGVLKDIYIILATHYIYAEKLMLGLELDKCCLRLSGKDEIAVEKCINELSNFVLYRDAKNRTEDVKMELVRSVEQFWTNVNQNQVSFFDKIGQEEKPFLSVKEAMGKLFYYKFKSYGFDAILKNDMDIYKTAAHEKTFSEWASEEQEKINVIFKEDADELDRLIADLRSKINNLNNYLNPHASDLMRKQ